MAGGESGIGAFSIARLPEILFGGGRVHELPGLAVRFGRRVLLVTGGSSIRSSPHWESILAGFEGEGIETRDLRITDEPSPQLVDRAVAEHRDWRPDLVVGIGGGSVLDGAKAIAGLLRTGTSVLDHLEGVGRGIPYPGPAVPMIAVPTTAGTGSEATKNAVLSVRGEGGYKKSFRDDQLVPRVALVDPELLAGCPRGLMAAQGMDAFTQLLEAYLSTRANPFTDALAWSGMEAFRDGLFPALDGDPVGRERIAYGAHISGICLAQTGLGSVHGLASPIGAFFPVPHGVVCGTLLAEATAINIRALEERDPQGTGLNKYARVGRMLARDPHLKGAEALDGLVEMLRGWVERLEIPRLSTFGMGEGDVARVVAGARGNSMKTNPLPLQDQELAELVLRRL